MQGRKYKQSFIKAKSWDEIEQFYEDLISKNWPLRDIVPLIRFIKNNMAFRNRLFACTSLDRLIISVYDPIELYTEALYIQYDKEVWNFKYYPYPLSEPEHERNYPGELLIEKFGKYVEMLKW